MSALEDCASNWQQLEQEWRKTQDEWRDSAARYFDHRFWHSIEDSTSKHLSALSELEQTLQATQEAARQLAR